MAETKIEWTSYRRPDGSMVPGYTFNPWRGCTKVSAGCANCYAETMSKRNPEVLGIWGDNGTRAVATESYWRQPLKWNREAEKAGKRRRVFCASLADVFERRSELEQPRGGLFRLIAETPYLDWLLLTKRPENVNYLSPWGSEAWPWPSNIWLGTSVENQEQADKRIPELLKVPARVRFLSCEPLLGPVDLTKWIGGLNATEELRRSGLQAGRSGNVGDRCRGQHLEERKKGEEASREGFGGVFSDSGDAQWDTLRGVSSSTGLEALQRPNPSRVDDQPQGRDQEEKSSRQLGTGNVLGATDPCSSGAREVQSKRGTQQQCETVRCGNQGDSHASGTRGASEEDRDRFPGQRQDDFQDCTQSAPSLHWIIAGGESGHGARPSHPEWFRFVRDQCVAAGIPYFFKQWGEWAPGSAIGATKLQPMNLQTMKVLDGRLVGQAFAAGYFEDQAPLLRVGKKTAGRVLDGRTWDESPRLEAYNA